MAAFIWHCITCRVWLSTNYYMPSSQDDGKYSVVKFMGRKLIEESDVSNADSICWPCGPVIYFCMTEKQHSWLIMPLIIKHNSYSSK